MPLPSVPCLLSAITMPNAIRHSILIVAIAGAAARVGSAQDVPALRPESTAKVNPQSEALTIKNNVLPMVEITGFLTLLSIYDRIVYANDTQDGKKVYSSTAASTWDHLRTQTWVFDQDPFNTNQFQHPYQGATMYGLARSAGHGFWVSLIHSNIGSFIWKMAGETDPPSLNDQITTGQAGSLLGEALYRMADLVLKDGGGTNTNALHEFSAALISPPGGLNRSVFGSRFKGKLPETAPATFWQFRFGGSLDALSKDVTSPLGVLHRDGTLEFSMAYGLPGQAGYEYTRPLDYFDFQFSALTNAKNPIENVMVRGLLVGNKVEGGANYRGIWGLYGSYDYISPYLFRVSSTALSLGHTGQLSIMPAVALQGTGMLGVGFGAAGSTAGIPSTSTNEAIRDYHYGVTPQALLALRLLVADRAMLDMTAREYYVSGTGSDNNQGSETIFRGDFGATLRVYKHHALWMQYVHSRRDATYGTVANRSFAQGTVTFGYAMLGGPSLGVVSWR
jgi:hypothetical protein